MKLDKETTTIMKGYGILFIAIHNLLHVKRFTGYVIENENRFNVQYTLDYFNTFRTIEWADIGQFFSFLGWIGLPVFLFLSGFGLVKKYEKDSRSFNIGSYLFHSWKKLALLLLPALLLYVGLSIVSGTWQSVIPRSFLQLTLLNNFLIPLVEVSPGVYWYFGLTFELYLLFILTRKCNIKQLFIILLGILTIQVLTIIIWDPVGDIWSWVRHNFIGWGHVFILGMIVAKTNSEYLLPNNYIILWLLAFVCLVSIPILMLSVWSWLLFVPFAALLFFLFFAGAISHHVCPVKVPDGLYKV